MCADWNSLAHQGAVYFATGEHVKAIACCDQLLSFFPIQDQESTSSAQKTKNPSFS